ncbi:hypothetical protein ACQP06_28055 [Nocardia sp. CA-136227]|uniref:hypothetical protein n=1 Tax=Nocardia sp. CA-136227 TaxID=3239979 RepID=UPI003D972E3E
MSRAERDPRPDQDSDQAPGTGDGEGQGAQPPEPAEQAGARSALEVASRSGRYALTAALIAAIVSSFVSAGSALYVSVNESNRSERQAAVHDLRTDRQKIYTDFSTAMFGVSRELGFLASRLRTHQSRGAVHEQIIAYAEAMLKFDAQLNLVLMAGSDGVVEVVTKLVDPVQKFTADYQTPFTKKWPREPASEAQDQAGWEQAEDAFKIAVLAQLHNLAKLNGGFIEAGQKDLR